MLFISGTFFDIREFHHQVLKLGPVPLKTLEYHISMWIEQTAPKLNSATSNKIQPLTLILTAFTVYCVQR